MMESSTVLNNNSLAFIGLCNEYCQTLESARETECDDFIAAMLRLLPRIYITASDLKIDDLGLEEPYIDGRLDEDYYDSIRRSIENLLGPDDTYLEVFEEDMKYSDTPIAASVSEGLADIFQVLYNFLEAIKDVPNELIDQALIAVKDDFQSYWSRIPHSLQRSQRTRLRAGSTINVNGRALIVDYCLSERSECKSCKLEMLDSKRYAYYRYAKQQAESEVSQCNRNASHKPPYNIHEKTYAAVGSRR